MLIIIQVFQNQNSQNSKIHQKYKNSSIGCKLGKNKIDMPFYKILEKNIFNRWKRALSMFLFYRIILKKKSAGEWFDENQRPTLWENNSRQSIATTNLRCEGDWKIKDKIRQDTWPKELIYFTKLETHPWDTRFTLAVPFGLATLHFYYFISYLAASRITQPFHATLAGTA